MSGDQIKKTQLLTRWTGQMCVDQMEKTDMFVC